VDNDKNADIKNCGSEPSSDQSLTRQEFLAKVIKGAALTGGLLAAPQVLDKFLVPKVYASSSGGGGGVTGMIGESTGAAGHTDFVPQQPSSFGTMGTDVTCTANGDALGTTSTPSFGTADTNIVAGTDGTLTC
jgi:hypothetical protein